MADALHSRRPDDEPPTPKWVYYVVAIAVILVALVFGAMHLSSGAIPQHGPP
jgi:hypothetical protein